MTHAPDEVLAALALGDGDIDPVVIEHVEGCPVCSQEVSELAHVHSLMLEEPGLPAPHLDAPGSDVWQRIVAETSTASGSSAGAMPGSDVSAAAEPVELSRPALRVVPGADQPGAHQPGRSGRHAGPTSRNRAWWLFAAAAACILVGALVGRAVWTGDGPSSTVVSSVALTTLDATKQKEGTAQLLDTRGIAELLVDTTTMPSTPGYVEVWLINTDGKRMVSLGVMSSPQAVFPVPADAIAQGYTVVDLSREQFDDKPQHSGDSIMRGTLPA